MRIKTKLMLLATGVLSYLVCKETLTNERRFDELQEYEQEVSKKIKMAERGVNMDNVIDVDFDRTE